MLGLGSGFDAVPLVLWICLWPWPGLECSGLVVCGLVPGGCVRVSASTSNSVRRSARLRVSSTVVIPPGRSSVPVLSIHTPFNPLAPVCVRWTCRSVRVSVLTWTNVRRSVRLRVSSAVVTRPARSSVPVHSATRLLLTGAPALTSTNVTLNSQVVKFQ